jgi:hypothetical protein
MDAEGQQVRSGAAPAHATRAHRAAAALTCRLLRATGVAAGRGRAWRGRGAGLRPQRVRLPARLPAGVAVPEVRRAHASARRSPLSVTPSSRAPRAPPRRLTRPPARARSFDILRDELGDTRTQFPHSMYMVAGSQADSAGANTITVVRLTQLTKTRKDGDDSDDSDDSDADGDAAGGPVLQSRVLAHHGCARVKPPAAAVDVARLTRRPRTQGREPHSRAAASAARGGHLGGDRARAGVGRQAAAAGAERRDGCRRRGAQAGQSAAAPGVHRPPDGGLCHGLVARGGRPPAVRRLQRRRAPVGAGGGRQARAHARVRTVADAAVLRARFVPTRRAGCMRRQRRRARLTRRAALAGGRLAALCFPATTARPWKTCSGAPTRRACSPPAAWMVRAGARASPAAAALRAYTRVRRLSLAPLSLALLECNTRTPELKRARAAGSQAPSASGTCASAPSRRCAPWFTTAT